MNPSGMYILNGEPRTLPSYIREAWQRRHVTLHLAASLMRSRIRGSALGVLLIIAHPLILAGIFAVVFGTAFKVDDLQRFTAYVLTGIVVFDYLSNCVSGSVTLIENAEPFTRQVRVPLINFILPHWLNSIILMLYGSFGVVIFSFLFPITGFNFAMIIMPLNIVYLSLCFAPVCVLFALVGDKFRGIRSFISYFMLLLYYLSPVFIPLSAFENSPLATWVRINPAAGAIDLLRSPVLDGRLPALDSYVSVGLLALISTLIAGVWLIKREGIEK